MNLGEIFNSLSVWEKLASVNMKPSLAYRIMKYMKLVSAEYEIANKQRISLIHEITGTKEGEDAGISPGTPEIEEYSRRYDEIMATESDLEPLGVALEEIVNEVEDKGEVFSVKDFALLGLFFSSEFKDDCDCDNKDDCEEDCNPDNDCDDCEKVS